jgi:toxin ParE1/3/4
MSSRELQLSLEAEDDLRSILEYTLATWGERQRDERALNFTAALETIVQFPSLGKIRHDKDNELHALLVREHFIYYRFDDAHVSIVRILHERMDVATHLPV